MQRVRPCCPPHGRSRSAPAVLSGGMRATVAVAAMLLLGGCRACKTDEVGPESTISHGSADPSSAPAPMTRLVIDPGNPLMVVRVAKRIATRLKGLGVSEQQVKIGGDRVHVDVLNTMADACAKALDGGRLDVFLFDERADPFAAQPEEHAKHFDVMSETLPGEHGAPATVHYLMGTPEERDALTKYLAEQASGSMPLVGPIVRTTSRPTETAQLLRAGGCVGPPARRISDVGLERHPRR